MNALVTGQRGFSLRVPDSWFAFDVRRATRTGDLARLVDARTAAQPRLRPYRSALLKMLREVADRAERRGAVYCAAAPADDPGGGTVATLLVFQTAGADDPTDSTVAAIAGALTARAPTQPGGPWRTVEIVSIPAGDAVRIRAVEPAALDGGTAVDTVTMQTLIPVPTTDHEEWQVGVLNIVLTSPHVGLADPLLDLFEAISDTLQWSAGDPPG
ncbi:hypothetical protein I6A60_08705 [Frankia sp. AgB1.9]|uniref:hypothetical protein n=1 Tax=unclassified Frankia TaxID=2632575 RepID=UPI001934730C|nr:MULTISPECIES: hypothetical protein [unclassified Frankia]MBL7487205.1 hypothetical protein [Frankia sp. AgW1.1]MBL7547950.1 hypothetical protein [Frankia sp. AgB1.9]MBL7623926.1 hypothetical protein [Frankia sp. AgB1.8]